MYEKQKLQAEITSLMSQRDMYKKRYENLVKKYDADIRALAKERDQYKRTCISFAEQIQELKKPNARNAGRKKNDEKWTERYDQFVELLDEGKNMKTIMDTMNISRATYFRFKKVYSEGGTNTDTE